MIYNNTRRKRTVIGALFCCGALLLFAGCQTTGGYDVRSEARAAKIDAALQRAAQEGASKGKSRASLAVLEQEYKKNSGDLETAMAYAGALREAGYFNRALIILAPLAGKDNAPSAIQSEYSMVVLGMGKYEEAENYARKAIRKNSENYKAYHALGIALDALGHHEQAEVAYRKGLDNWQGDPTPIMNNLALNLATQGLLDEAAQILRRAADAAPQRTEIARNLRIVSALQKTQDYNRPKVSPKIDPDKLVRPAHKPEKDS